MNKTHHIHVHVHHHMHGRKKATHHKRGHSVGHDYPLKRGYLNNVKTFHI